MKPIDRQAMFAVEITTDDGPVVSRYYPGDLTGAREWARWCSRRWPARVLEGGAGGRVVQTYALRTVAGRPAGARS